MVKKTKKLMVLICPASLRGHVLIGMGRGVEWSGVVGGASQQEVSGGGGGWWGDQTLASLSPDTRIRRLNTSVSPRLI